MFDQIFERSDALRRQYAAPLVEERKAYLRHWAERGAAREHLRHLARCLLVITKRLHLESNGSVTIGQIKRAADQWARRPFKRHKSRFVGVATKWLRFLGRLQVSEDRTQSFAQLMADFEKYLDQERALAPRTIKDHCWRVENFLRRALHVTRGLSGVTIRQIDKGLALKGRQSGHPRQAIRSYASCLRLFFRYAEHRNLCRRGLADTITAPRMYRHEGLPSAPSWEEVQRVLADSEGDRPTSIRDRAILMLLAVYGLRSGEVRSLRLEDIDWENDRLRVCRSKARRTQTFPLPATVANSILRYLREVRPRSEFREVFLTLRTPLRPLGSSAVFEIVRRHWRSLGPSIRPRGPHALRHACATRLINCGLTLKEIGDLLGHRDADSTRIYAKVDLPHLRTVGDIDLGGLL
jgi:integrase/recombinase XerD